MIIQGELNSHYLKVIRKV